MHPGRAPSRALGTVAHPSKYCESFLHDESIASALSGLRSLLDSETCTNQGRET